MTNITLSNPERLILLKLINREVGFANYARNTTLSRLENLYNLQGKLQNKLKGE